METPPVQPSWANVSPTLSSFLLVQPLSKRGELCLARGGVQIGGLQPGKEVSLSLLRLALAVLLILQLVQVQREKGDWGGNGG